MLPSEFRIRLLLLLTFQVQPCQKRHSHRSTSRVPKPGDISLAEVNSNVIIFTYIQQKYIGEINLLFTAHSNPARTYPLLELQKCIRENPEQWRPLVFTNGCFDLLHVGHLRYLQAAKTLGRSLIIGLNSDQSVQLIKPPKPGFPPRPIIPEQQRAEMLCYLKPVDAVVVFSEPTATSLISTLKPDIYVKGGDYTPTTLPEYPAVQACGCRLELIKIEIPTSTSAIINKILDTPKNP